MSFRITRGIKVEVETTEVAELDVALNDLKDDFVERVAKSLSHLPIAKGDVAEPPARIRQFGDYDVCFLVTRDNHQVWTTVIRVWPTPDREVMRMLVRATEAVDMFRGAVGV